MDKEGLILYFNNRGFIYKGKKELKGFAPVYFFLGSRGSIGFSQEKEGWLISFSRFNGAWYQEEIKELTKIYGKCDEEWNENYAHYLLWHTQNLA